MNDLIIRIPDKCKADISIAKEFLLERNDLLNFAENLVIDSPDSFAIASSLKADFNKFFKKCETQRKDLQRPFNSVVTTIRDHIKKELSEFELAKAELQTKLNSFAAKQRAIEMKEQKDAEEKRQSQIEQQIADSDLEAEFLEEAPKDEIVIEPLPVKSKLRGAQVAEILKYEIFDKSKLPQAWIQIDDRAVKEYMKTFSETVRNNLKLNDFRRGGVRFYIDVQVRAK